IKVLAAHIADRPESKARFEREAQVLASLSHPHICPVFDVGYQDGMNYLVMEYLEGQTLAGRLEKGALPVAGRRMAVHAGSSPLTVVNEIRNSNLMPGRLPPCFHNSRRSRFCRAAGTRSSRWQSPLSLTFAVQGVLQLEFFRSQRRTQWNNERISMVYMLPSAARSPYAFRCPGGTFAGCVIAAAEFARTHQRYATGKGVRHAL